jgi:hypothetical protein
VDADLLHQRDAAMQRKVEAVPDVKRHSWLGVLLKPPAEL